MAGFRHCTARPVAPHGQFTHDADVRRSRCPTALYLQDAGQNKQFRCCRFKKASRTAGHSEQYPPLHVLHTTARTFPHHAVRLLWGTDIRSPGPLLAEARWRPSRVTCGNGAV